MHGSCMTWLAMFGNSFRIRTTIHTQAFHMVVAPGLMIQVVTMSSAVGASIAKSGGMAPVVHGLIRAQVKLVQIQHLVSVVLGTSAHPTASARTAVSTAVVVAVGAARDKMRA